MFLSFITILKVNLFGLEILMINFLYKTALYLVKEACLTAAINTATSSD